MIIPIAFRRASARCFLILFLAAGSFAAGANPDPSSGSLIPGVDTQFTGIRFEIVSVTYTIKNRLLVLVRIRGTGKTPPAGIFLGTVPPHPTTWDMGQDTYQPKPFSIRSAVMTDDLSQEKYHALSPVAAPGKGWLPDTTATRLHAMSSVYLELQFEVPPPPPPPLDGSKPPKQTLSFLLPKATGPILNVPLPDSLPGETIVK